MVSCGCLKFKLSNISSYLKLEKKIQIKKLSNCPNSSIVKTMLGLFSELISVWHPKTNHLVTADTIILNQLECFFLHWYFESIHWVSRTEIIWKQIQPKVWCLSWLSSWQLVAFPWPPCQIKGLMKERRYWHYQNQRLCIRSNSTIAETSGIWSGNVLSVKLSLYPLN